MKKKILGIGSIALASIGLFLSISTPYYPPLGDVILKSIGIRAWGNVEIGFPLLCGMVIICVGFMGMSEYLYKEYPKTYNKGIWLVLGVTALLVTGGNKYVQFNKSMQPGLKAIQFVYDNSKFEYEYEGEKVLNASGLLEFKNYSNTSRSFYVKYIPDDEFSSQFSAKELIGYQRGTESPKLIRVEPKSTSKIQVELNKSMVVSDGDKGSRGRGSRSIETVIIYNDQEHVKFTGDNFMGK